MDSRDITVFKHIMQALRANERVFECKIPKTGDWQTIFTLRSIIKSEPAFSCFRVLASNSNGNVCILRVANAGSPLLATRSEKNLRSTRQLAEEIRDKASSEKKPSTVKQCGVEGGLVDILLKMDAQNQSYVPPPVARSSTGVTQNATVYPVALSRNAFEGWLNSDSRVVVIYGAPGCGKSNQIVHYILEHCNIRSQNCRAICVLQDDVEVLVTAWRISDERHEKMGSTVGYKLCTTSRVSDCTNVAFCSDKVVLLSLLSNANRQAFVELTHLVVGNVGRRTASKDFLLSLLKEKHQLHPTLKIVLLTESKDVAELAMFFNRSSVIMVPEVKDSEIDTDMLMPFGVEYITLDSVLTHISTRREVLEMRTRMLTEHPLKVMADMQERYGDMNQCCYLWRHMDFLLERCFYAGTPGGFSAMLEVIERHKHLVDYQHTEIKLTALMIASAKDFRGVVETLLKLGANPYTRGKKGITALDWCDKNNPNSCWQLMVDACQRYSKADTEAGGNRERLIAQLYHRVQNPYEVDLMLVHDIVMYITAKRKTGKIIVILPDFTGVLECYASLRASAPAKAHRMNFMILHQYVTEHEVQMMRKFPWYPNFLVILTEGSLLETLPSLSGIDYVIDTGLRVERVYSPVKEAYYNRMCYNTKHTVSFMKSIPKQGFFSLYTDDQLDSMPMNEKSDRNCSGLSMQVLQALLSLDRSSPSVEMFFDSALTPPAGANVTRSIQILTQIGAIEQPLRAPTNLGVMLAHLQLEVHLGKALLYSCLFQCLDPVLTIVTMLHMGNPFLDPVDGESAVNMVATKRIIGNPSYSDHLVLLRLYQQWSDCKMKLTDEGMVNKYRLKTGVMEAIANMRVELMSVLRSLGLVKCGRKHNADQLNKHSENWVRVKACLTAGFYPNLARVDYEKRSFRDFCGTDAPLELHPLSVVNLENLPTRWVIYDHKEDFMLALQDHSNDDSPVHMAENMPISDCMVMLMCDIDEHLANSTPAGETEWTTRGTYLLPFVSQCDVARPDNNNKELLIGKRYAFQLTFDCYNAVVWLRKQIGRLFHEFISNPMETLAREDTSRILTHVGYILDKEEKNICPSELGGIGVRPKIRNRSPMGVCWNSQFKQAPRMF